MFFDLGCVNIKKEKVHFDQFISIIEKQISTKIVIIYYMYFTGEQNGSEIGPGVIYAECCFKEEKY